MTQFPTTEPMETLLQNGSPLHGRRRRRMRGAGRAESQDVAKADPGPVDQVRAVFGIQRKTFWVNAIAFLLAAPMGGAVPCFVSHLAHQEVAGNPWLWLPVVGGCWFSATTVARWGTRAFGDAAKAWGFTLLLEASMIMSQSPAVCWMALGMLAAINALATACTLILDNRRCGRPGASSPAV